MIVLKSFLSRPMAYFSGLGWGVGLILLGGSATVAQAPIDQLTPVAPVKSPAAAAIEPAPAAIEPPPAAIAPPVEPSAGGAFIDRTDYSLGATQREPSVIVQPRIAQPPLPASTARANAGLSVGTVSVAPVQVGPVSLSSGGVSWNSGDNWSPEAPAPSIQEGYSTVKAYFNRTIRPLGLPGNGNFKLLFPLAIPAPITSLFGWRIHPITGMARMHTGSDIGAPLGTPVLAALTGRVIMADWFGGYGIAIALEHASGNQQTLYAHLSEIFVKPGDIVQQGTVIGRVGSTGASTGPHLHFEFRQQTDQGWVAMDSGLSLETAATELVKSLQVAQTPPAPKN
jgi:murein DD-endopeptidase MepM/ murein hydrolase activator NlpD